MGGHRDWGSRWWLQAAQEPPTLLPAEGFALGDLRDCSRPDRSLGGREERLHTDGLKCFSWFRGLEEGVAEEM